MREREREREREIQQWSPVCVKLHFESKNSTFRFSHHFPSLPSRRGLEVVALKFAMSSHLSKNVFALQEPREWCNIGQMIAQSYCSNGSVESIRPYYVHISGLMYSGKVYEPPHAQSLFLFPIVFGIYIYMSMYKVHASLPLVCKTKEACSWTQSVSKLTRGAYNKTPSCLLVIIVITIIMFGLWWALP